MAATSESTEIMLKNILYLTDFSNVSRAALPFATTIGRNYGANVHALHILTPVIPEVCEEAIKADEALARSEMKEIESMLGGVAHRATIAEGMEMWPAIERAIREDQTDLIVLGTQGRTGATKLLLGSVAEEIFRRSTVPVLTIGPDVPRRSEADALFGCILLAIDFGHESLAALPYVLSLANGEHARVVLLHVIRKRSPGGDNSDAGNGLSVAEVFHRLYETIPKDAVLTSPPEVAIKFGRPADEILKAAKEYSAGLIVLGVRDASRHMLSATHLDRPTAHKVVAHAACPVLTIRA